MFPDPTAVSLETDDYFSIPRPRGVLRMLLELVGLRTRRTMARERGDTIVDVAQVLSAAGRAGQVVSRDPAGDTWSVLLGPPQAAVPATSPESA